MTEQFVLGSIIIMLYLSIHLDFIYLLAYMLTIITMSYNSESGNIMQQLLAASIPCALFILQKINIGNKKKKLLEITIS